MLRKGIKRFTCQDIKANYHPIKSESERLSKVLESSVKALLYPKEAQHLSTFGELSSYYVLKAIRQKMTQDSVGLQILKEKPRIRPPYVNIEELRALPVNTLGRKYAYYMDNNAFEIQERPLVKHIGDIELAYIYQRYKEIHDLLHVSFEKDVSVYEELEVKWFEFQQLELASAGMSALVGSALLPPQEAWQLFTQDGPKMIKQAKKAKFCMNVYFEKHFEQDFQEFKNFFLNNY